MKYQEDLMAEWDEYAAQKTAKREGREEGREEKEKLFVTNLLKDGEFSISKIATLVDVSESFVRRIKKEIKIS